MQQLSVVFDGIKQGHLISASEQLFNEYKRKKLVLSAVDRGRKLKPDEVKEFLAQLEQIDGQDMETYTYYSKAL